MTKKCGKESKIQYYALVFISLIQTIETPLTQTKINLVSSPQPHCSNRLTITEGHKLIKQ